MNLPGYNPLDGVLKKSIKMGTVLIEERESTGSSKSMIIIYKESRLIQHFIDETGVIGVLMMERKMVEGLVKIGMSLSKGHIDGY